MRRGYDEVQRFASIMLTKLNTPKNAAKGAWDDCSLDYLKRRLAQERQEVDDALDALAHGEATIDEVCGELADEGNFLMMIHERLTNKDAS